MSKVPVAPAFARAVAPLVACATAVLLAASSPVSLAAPAPEEAPPVDATRRIDDLAWLAGTWRGEVDGDRVEETWGAPLGRAMVGYFRWMNGEEAYLYELLVLEEDQAGVQLRLRHFYAGLKPWASEKEAPMAWQLASNASMEAVFESEAYEFPHRIVYHRETPERLVVRLEGTREGQPAQMTFTFRRVP